MEIVAPAGDYSKLEAAILGGADSVYLGLKGFGARRKAGNFTMDELKTAIDMAHLYKVKLYLTLNTIFRDGEIEALYENIKTIYEYGIDAFIVQDFGMAEFLKRNFPEAEIHGSTQMTVANHIEAQYLKDLGFKRVVLARELSFEEIEKIKSKVDIDLEIFVSGALCISYSGNCYFSSFIGSRSGNRGMCAQPCRKKYSSGESEGYFLSPKDQMLDIDDIDRLNKIGVESIKVEGRMKSVEYVYSMTAYYKNILSGVESIENKPEKLFNRGYSKGYFYGKEKIINSNYSFDLGSELGKIKNKKLLLKEDLALGDGIVFLDKNYNKIDGHYINKISIDGKKLEKAFAGDKIDLICPPKTAYIYKNFDKNIFDSVKHRLKQHKRKEGISMYLYVHSREKLRLRLNAWGNEIELFGPILDEARKKMEVDKLSEKLSEIGDSPFFPLELKVDYDDKAFVPFNILKQIKRDAVSLLCEVIKGKSRRKAPPKWKLEHGENIETKIPSIRASVKYKWQKELLNSLGIEEVFIKNPDTAREGIIDKIDLENPLAGTMYQLLCNKNDKVTLDWNQNISNSYAFYVLRNIDKLASVILSPELKWEDLKKISSFGLKKEVLIYGHLKLMYIEAEIEGKKLRNEKKDEFILIKNEFGHTEIYYGKPMNLIPKLDLVRKLGCDVMRLEFTIEDEATIRNVVANLKTQNGEYTPYNFERGVY
jgi:putative protease